MSEEKGRDDEGGGDDGGGIADYLDLFAAYEAELEAAPSDDERGAIRIKYGFGLVGDAVLVDPAARDETGT